MTIRRLAVTGGDGVSKCGRLTQRTIMIVILTYVTYLQNDRHLRALEAQHRHIYAKFGIEVCTSDLINVTYCYCMMWLSFWWSWLASRRGQQLVTVNAMQCALLTGLERNTIRRLRTTYYKLSCRKTPKSPLSVSNGWSLHKNSVLFRWKWLRKRPNWL